MALKVLFDLVANKTYEKIKRMTMDREWMPRTCFRPELNIKSKYLLETKKFAHFNLLQI